MEFILISPKPVTETYFGAMVDIIDFLKAISKLFKELEDSYFEFILITPIYINGSHFENT